MARILTYLINYFIRKPDQYIDYNVLNEKLKEHFDDKLPKLPEFPDQVPTSIKIRLSLFLPTKDRSTLTITVRTLRTYTVSTDFLKPTFTKISNYQRIPEI